MPEDSEGLEHDDVEITEKMSIEGAKDYLDSEKNFMDELDVDVDVPTAAYRVGEPGWRKLLWGEKQLKVESTYDSFKETKEASEEIEKFEHKELVTREDYREALREAVQQAREQERRRIQNVIESFEEQVLSRLKRLCNSQLADPTHPSYSKKWLEENEAIIEHFEQTREELEEEAGSKTGDSDSTS